MFCISKSQKMIMILLGVGPVVVYCSQFQRDVQGLSFEHHVLFDCENSLRGSESMLNHCQWPPSARERLVLQGPYCVGGGSCVEEMSKAINGLRLATNDLTGLLEGYLYHAPKMQGRVACGLSFRGSLISTQFFGDLHDQATRTIYESSISARRYQYMLDHHEKKLGEIVLREFNDHSRMMREVTLAQQFLPVILKQRTAAEHLNFVIWSILAQVQQLTLATPENGAC